MLDSLVRNYSLESKIGEGSFSEVLKVMEKSTGRFFAAKRLTQTFVDLEDVNKYPELKVMLQLQQHPNILNLFEWVYESDCRILTLIFNLMDMSLYEYIRDRKRKLSEQRCKNFLFQLANALAFLHRHGVFHRDVKPENILVRTDKEMQKTNPTRAVLVQLGDLGSVAYKADKLPHTEYISTRWYRAPECLLTSGKYGPKMDMWALGCCFYEICTLQPLFPGENEIDQLDKIHSILGSPSVKTLEKFKCPLALATQFPRQQALNLFKLVPSMSFYGVDVLKRMLNYTPDTRLSAKKLFDHPYFSDIRKIANHDPVQTRLMLSQSKDSSRASSARSSLASMSLDSSSFTFHRKRDDHSLDKLQIELQKTLNKERERNWNKPNSDMKRKILSNNRTTMNNNKLLCK